MRTEIEVDKSPKLLVLSHQTPMQAGVSDHNILIHDNTLFFNMMMQCQWNAEKSRFNNGFGLVETDAQYQQRIAVIVQVIAEVVAMNPQISMIGLAEAPIKLQDIDCFIQACKKYPSLHRFMENLVPDLFTPMGIATLIDSEQFQVVQVNRDDAVLRPSLKHRIQEFLLTRADSQQFRLFNLHLPYDLAKSKDQACLIAFARELFRSEAQIPVLVMGDFNIYPKVIAKKLPTVSMYVQTANNLIIHTNPRGKITGFELETVDGVLKDAALTRRQSLSYMDATNFATAGLQPKQEQHLLGKFLLSKIGLFHAAVKRKLQVDEKEQAVWVRAYAFS